MEQAAARVITDLDALPHDAAHRQAWRALLHRSDGVQVTSYRLDPGGVVPPHHHSASWDIAVVLEGEIAITTGQDGAVRTERGTAGTVSLVPPGTVHALVNASPTRPARFLLVQSQPHAFDFVRHPEDQARAADHGAAGAAHSTR